MTGTESGLDKMESTSPDRAPWRLYSLKDYGIGLATLTILFCRASVCIAWCECFSR